MWRKFDIPPIWALGAALLGQGLHFLLPYGNFARPATQGAAVAFGAFGVMLAAWAMIRFRLNKTPVEPRNTPKALVADGPYRFNRNPMYTGLTLLVFGLALWLGSPFALLAAVALPFILTERFIRAEEAGLAEAFPEEAKDFFSRTRRW